MENLTIPKSRRGPKLALAADESLAFDITG